MFKSWRSDKKKIKAVFKLQFQATQVPQLKKPALTVSLMPEDVGKPTFKLEKAAVQDGTCLWENPVYVAVKLIKEPKSGKLNEKIYHFIVSSGSSKSGYHGEASIDFADFAEEIEPLTVSLPLKFANSGAILHVTIQKMQGGADQRKKEDHDPTLSQDGSLKNYLSNGYTDGDNNSFAENAEQDGSFRASSVGSNASFQSSLRQNSVPQETVDTTITTKNRFHRISSTDWSPGSASDGSLFDPTNSPENNLPREIGETSDESIEKLKNEISSLMRQAELSELELQSLQKRVMKENRRGQDLSRQISDLKEERDELATECEQLKSSLKCVDRMEYLNRLQAENENSRAQLEEIRQELSHEKELNSNLKLQLQKTEDSNCELILAVRDLDEMLEQKNREISCLLGKLELSKKADQIQEKTCECDMKKDDHQQALPAPGELTGEQNDAEEMHLLKQKIIDLSDEIEVYRENGEKMENYVKQLAQDYEDLKQENQDIYSRLEQNQQQELKTQNEFSESLATIKELESQGQRLEEKLKKQTQELSESLVSINELETQVKGLKKELEKQAQGFENDLDAMTNDKIRQEQRAISAEEALRKTRWKNAITAERLQEEFRRLSVDMAGKFDENEKVTVKALTEANELRVQKRIMEENLQKAIVELALIKDQNRVKVEELSAQLDLKIKHIEQMSLELEDKSKQLRYAQKNGGEMEEALSLEIKTPKATIKMLKKERNDVSEQAEEMKLRDETQQMKKSFDDTKMLAERWKGERDELEGKFILAKKEAKKTQDQLLLLESLKDEKEKMVKNLLSEVQSLRAQYIAVKHSLSREALEKQNLQQEVVQLRGELRKNEEESTSMEKFKNNNAQATFSDEKDRTPSTASKLVEKEVGVALLESKVKTCSEQDLKVSTLRAKDECNLTKLLTEMALLKEQNKSMESELKEMEERYSEISLKFAEVEGERQQLVMTVRNLKNSKKN